MVASFIDGMVSDTSEQWQTLELASRKPHTLDSALVERTQRVYSEQLETTALFKEQLARWCKEALSPARAGEVARLEGQVERLRTNLTDILDRVDEVKVKDKTIDKMLEKEDFELGLEFLLGKHRLGGSLRARPHRR
jgi:hypothetical protein